MTTMLEMQCPLEVDTPKGRGNVILVTEYGLEQPKLFTVVIHDTGEIWEFFNSDILATKNITVGRRTQCHSTPSSST